MDEREAPNKKGVQRQRQRQRKTGSSSRGKSVNSSLKVVYISTPMKVETSASRFRSLVQQLTGKDSDISPHYYMDDHRDAAVNFNLVQHSPPPPAKSSDDSSENSAAAGRDSLAADDSPIMDDDEFLGFLSNEYFSSSLDTSTAFGSYHQLL
ncbi:sigma factor binding protein 1, chloroplastic-like [Andrographis paniculata]|uniref:sigma factor binding protein 1, chloroplastic-like n=1 Tax=Andrographis paniculata TaxID=175694 RepID=UPI0021E89CAD|nr:sigma factor binding protein 1, chloroplastic-like [Andrographis paniculata]